MEVACSFSFSWVQNKGGQQGFLLDKHTKSSFFCAWTSHNRVLQRNSAWSFDKIFFWLFIFTGRDTSWPSRHSCWSGEHWSHWRNFSGIPFLFGGICVPVSNSLYWKTCIPKRCRMEEGIMKPVQLTDLLPAYSLIGYSSNMDWTDAPMHTRSYLQCWKSILLGSLSHYFL